MPIAISILALATSVFTFYWINIRDKKALYFVRIPKMGRPADLIFALANSGKKDVLITGIACYFEMPNGGKFYPGANVVCSRSGNDLLAAGSAFECAVSIAERFQKSFVETGKKNDGLDGTFGHFAGIDINWIDMNGSAYSATVIHSRLYLDIEGKIRGGAPITGRAAKYDLYQLAA